MRSFILVILTAAVAALALPLPARAQLDVSGSWVMPIEFAFPETCTLDFVQSGTDLQLMQSCPVFQPDAAASGTIDLDTRTFTASGACGFGVPGGFSYTISGTVSPDGLTIDGSFFCTGIGNSISYTATRCGNGTIDPGEDCEPPAGCCTGCQFATGASCPAAPCVSGTCDAGGACVAGAPEPSGTACAVDDDNCTIEACDGAGACLINEVVPCHDVCAFCDESHTCIGDPRNLGSSPDFSPDGCWRPLETNSRVVVANAGTGRLQWSLGLETQTTLEDFGDPINATGYQLCAFYRAGYGDAWKFLTAVRAEPGGNWDANARGFRFRDPAAAGGFSLLRLKSRSEPGETRIKLNAKGSLLGLPPDFTALGFGPQGQVQVEVRADNGQCWGAHFTTEYGLRVRESVMRGNNGG